MTPLEVRGVLWGLLAVASFSLTLPATRAAVPHLGVGLVAFGRAIGAGLLAALILWVWRGKLPELAHWIGLAVTSLGVVVGFPFLTTVAMAHVPASHGAIVVGLLPLSTSVAGALMTGERPSLGFWLMSLLGTGILLAFVMRGSVGGLATADLALVGGVISAAIGYAKGGQLARQLGGWQVICWALLLALPVLGLIAVFTVSRPTVSAPITAWLGFAYVTLVSQLIGFFAWYHGLALGGIARVSQTQLLQLFLTLGASALLLGERIDMGTIFFAIAVVMTVAAGTRYRATAPPRPTSDT